MIRRMESPRWTAALFAVFLLPALHPLVRPALGAPSHLLWWVHVLPVAFLTFHRGRQAAAVAMGASALMVAGGEAAFGGGYGVAADGATVASLTVALTLTHLLVVAFALYARAVSLRLRVLFDRVRTGIVRVDADDRVQRVNPAAARILGCEDPQAVRGRPRSALFEIPGVDHLHALERLGSWTGHIEVRHAPEDGEAPRRVPVVLVVVHDEDTGGHQVLMADRTLEVLQEQEMQRQARLASLGEALAGVAHELNNPLATVMAHAELGALAADDPEEVRASFEVIREQATRMRDLVRELLGFSRKESAETCMDLGPWIGKVVRVQQVSLGRGIRVEADVRWEGRVRVSSTKVEQVLLNLLSNAAHAVRTGGGSRIVVSVERRGGEALLEVRDDGPGVAPEIADRLFEPFATTKPEGEGTGLGLAISRRLARSWGGDLTVGPAPEGGACFRLTLPVADVDDVAACGPEGAAA